MLKNTLIYRELLIILSTVTFLLTVSMCFGASYYVDATNGNDNYDGLTEFTAWKTIAKVNASNFQPGDEILFKGGETWREQLTVPSSGLDNLYITFGSYGSAGPATIKGSKIVTQWEQYRSGVYRAYVTSDPARLFLYGVDLARSSTKDNLGDHEWCWESSYLYIRLDAGNPNDAEFIIEASQNSYGIYISNKHFIKINNITIDKARYYGIGIQDASSDIIIENCRLFQSAKHGIFIFNAAMITLDSCLTANNYQSGIAVWNGLNGGTFRRGMSYGNGENGIVLENGVTNILIENFSIYDNGDEGIDIAGVFGSTVEGVKINSSEVFNNGLRHSEEGHGVNIGYSGYVKNVAVYDCRIYRNSAYGIFIGNGTEGHQIVNCMIEGNLVRALRVTGDNVIIKNNVMKYSGSDVEIRVETNVKDVDIDYNSYCGLTRTRWMMGDTVYSDLALWQKETSYDLNSVPLEQCTLRVPTGLRIIR